MTQGREVNNYLDADLEDVSMTLPGMKTPLVANKNLVNGTTSSVNTLQLALASI